MIWNYRLVRYRDEKGFGLHEVYYDDDGLPCGMTDAPIDFTCGIEEGPEQIAKGLRMALDDAINRPIFDEPENWPGKWPGNSAYSLKHTPLISGDSRARVP